MVHQFYEGLTVLQPFFGCGLELLASSASYYQVVVLLGERLGEGATQYRDELAQVVPGVSAIVSYGDLEAAELWQRLERNRVVQEARVGGEYPLLVYHHRVEPAQVGYDDSVGPKALGELFTLTVLADVDVDGLVEPRHHTAATLLYERIDGAPEAFAEVVVGADVALLSLEEVTVKIDVWHSRVVDNNAVARGDGALEVVRRLVELAAHLEALVDPIGGDELDVYVCAERNQTLVVLKIGGDEVRGVLGQVVEVAAAERAHAAVDDLLVGDGDLVRNAHEAVFQEKPAVRRVALRVHEPRAVDGVVDPAGRGHGDHGGAGGVELDEIHGVADDIGDAVRDEPVAQVVVVVLDEGHAVVVLDGDHELADVVVVETVQLYDKKHQVVQHGALRDRVY